jgi:hypothetical protein
MIDAVNNDEGGRVEINVPVCEVDNVTYSGDGWASTAPYTARLGTGGESQTLCRASHVMVTSIL